MQPFTTEECVWVCGREGVLHMDPITIIRKVSYDQLLFSPLPLCVCVCCLPLESDATSVFIAQTSVDV